MKPESKQSNNNAFYRWLLRVASPKRAISLLVITAILVTLLVTTIRRIYSLEGSNSANIYQTYDAYGAGARSAFLPLLIIGSSLGLVWPLFFAITIVLIYPRVFPRLQHWALVPGYIGLALEVVFHITVGTTLFAYPARVEWMGSWANLINNIFLPMVFVASLIVLATGAIGTLVLMKRKV